MQAGVWVVGSGIRDDNREEIETAVGLNNYLFSMVLQLEYKNCKIANKKKSSCYFRQSFSVLSILENEPQTDCISKAVQLLCICIPCEKDTSISLFPWMEVNSSCPLVISVTVGVAPGLCEVRFTVSKQQSASSQYSG